MGVKATLLGVTLTAADISQAESLGIDVKGMMATAGAKCDDLKQLLGVIINDVLTPASDAANITTLNAQITALSWSGYDTRYHIKRYLRRGLRPCASTWSATRLPLRGVYWSAAPKVD